jgi:hypothetical protein
MIGRRPTPRWQSTGNPQMLEYKAGGAFRRRCWYYTMMRPVNTPMVLLDC